MLEKQKYIFKKMTILKKLLESWGYAKRYRIGTPYLTPDRFTSTDEKKKEIKR